MFPAHTHTHTHTHATLVDSETQTTNHHSEGTLKRKFLTTAQSLRTLASHQLSLGFSDSSIGKESACNAGDPGSIPGPGRSTGEGIGYLLQYPWASLVAQLVKNLPAMWETWVRSLGWGGPLEKGKATHSSILTWRIPWTV